MKNVKTKKKAKSTKAPKVKTKIKAGKVFDRPGGGC